MTTIKMSMDQILSIKKQNNYHKDVTKIINDALNTIRDTNVIKIMKHNPLETLVPFNLWWNHPMYRIVDEHENNQHLRCRYFKNALLTPLIGKSSYLNHLKSFLENLSLYQPFYPETFYMMWEFL